MSMFKIQINENYTNLAEYYNKIYNYTSDCGLDLYIPEDIIVEAKQTKLIDLQIRTEFIDANNINLGYIICPRSSIYKKKIRLANSIGIIDPEYRGNLKVAIDNIGDHDEKLLKGERYFQIIFIKMLKPDEIQIVTELSKTNRASNGFGSTGL